MIGHAYPYVRVIKHCLHCGKQIPGRGGKFCWDDPCQAARKVRKKAVEKAWCAIHKPWRVRNYEHRAKQEPESSKSTRKCQYKFCTHKRDPLPTGYYFYHSDCHERLCHLLGRGIDTAQGVTL